MTDAPQVTYGQDVALSLPTPESEERMPVRRTDWKRLRKFAETLDRPMACASNYVSFFAGAALALFLAFIQWLVSYDESAEAGWTWVAPGLMWGFIACAVLACIIFFMSRSIEEDSQNRVELFCQDMDEIEGHHPPAVHDPGP